jgi:hypothetical protein
MMKSGGVVSSSMADMGQTQPIQQISDQSGLSPTTDLFFVEAGEAGSRLPPTFIILYRKARLRADIELLAIVVTWDTGIAALLRYAKAI